MDDDRQIQADSDMSVELLLVLLYIDNGGGGIVTDLRAGTIVCVRTAEVDRARDGRIPVLTRTSCRSDNNAISRINASRSKCEEIEKMKEKGTKQEINLSFSGNN